MSRDKTNKTQIPKRVALFCCICLAILIASLIKKDVDFSQFENRTMEYFRWPDINSVISGEWFDSFEKYNLDQVIGRDTFVKANTRILKAIGKRQINRMTECDDETILKIPFYFQAPAKIDKSFTESVLTPLKEAAGSYGGQLYYMNVYPRRVFFWDSFPYHRDERREDYHLSNEEDLQSLSEMGIYTVDTYPVTEEHSGEYLFFHSDHHYTYKCAYYSYLTLLDAINSNNPDRKPLDFPEWEQMDVYRPQGEFWGSLVSFVNDGRYEVKDYLEYALPADYPPVYVRLEDGKPSDIPLIRQDDKTEYGCFMSGDYGNTVIRTNRPERPNILIIGYSFTNAIELMAIYDFNEVHSIDPRMFEGDIAQYAREARCDYVVVQDVFELE